MIPSLNSVNNLTNLTKIRPSKIFPPSTVSTNWINIVKSDLTIRSLTASKKYIFEVAINIQTNAAYINVALSILRLEKDRQQAKQEADDMKASLDHVTKDKVIIEQSAHIKNIIYSLERICWK